MSQQIPVSASQKNFIDAINNWGKNEPVAVGGAIAFLVTAGLGVASSFGYVLEGAQVDAVFYFLAALIGVISILQRQRAFGPVTVAKGQADYEAKIADLTRENVGPKARAPRGKPTKPARI